MNHFIICQSLFQGHEQRVPGCQSWYPYPSYVVRRRNLGVLPIVDNPKSLLAPSRARFKRLAAVVAHGNQILTDDVFGTLVGLT
jgi:hypothetical protein